MFQAVGDSTWVYVLACNQKDLHKICPNLWNFRTDHVQRSRVLCIFLTLKAKGHVSKAPSGTNQPKTGTLAYFLSQNCIVPICTSFYLSLSFPGLCCIPFNFRRKNSSSLIPFGGLEIPAQMIKPHESCSNSIRYRGSSGFKRSDFFFRFRWKPAILPCRIPHWYGPDLCPLDFHARFVRQIPGLQIRLKAGIWNIPDYRNI